MYCKKINTKSDMLIGIYLPKKASRKFFSIVPFVYYLHLNLKKFRFKKASVKNKIT